MHIAPIPDTVGLPLEPSARLQRDKAYIATMRADLANKHQAVADGSMTGLVVAGAGAEGYLQSSLPRFVAQAEEIDMRTATVLVCNDGGHFPQLLEQMRSQMRVVCGWFGPKRSLQDQPELYADADLQHSMVLENSDESALYVLHQPRGHFESGQIRGLRAGYQTILNALGREGFQTEWLMKFDAESHFLANPGRGSRSVDPHSNGLEHYRDVLRGARQATFVGAKHWLTAYKALPSGERVPDTAAAVEPLYEVLSRLSGTRFHQMMCGPGYAGRYADMLATGLGVTITCPSALSEDGTFQVLAQETGQRCQVTEQCLATNACPPKGDLSNMRRQLLRWFSSYSDLMEHYQLQSPPLWQRLAKKVHDAAVYWRDPLTLLRAFSQMRPLAEEAKKKSRRPLDRGPASWEHNAT